ncbi:MAG: 16S rRNA (adenine(1518)-N(6)/adenine(1519)-N(6))-dimethyltransferase RsmA [Culicoidibacterales bacterium]
MKKIATWSETKRVLDKHHFSLKKKFGQNFLIDQNILRKIVEVASVEDKHVVEIGPGIGALTQFIADDAASVHCFEVDETLKPILAETLNDYPNVEVIFQDILKSQFETYDFLEKRFSVVANLPYYITTPIIEHLIPYRKQIDSITIMMQKEVAERIQAAPGSKQYGSLSIYLQTYFDAEIAFVVPRTVFMPPPDVESAILHLVPKKQMHLQEEEIATFEKIIRAAFATRRKTILNNLQRLYGKEKTIEYLESAKITSNLRPEQISIDSYSELSRIVYEDTQNVD